MGLRFPGLLGLAAGFDKNGVGIDAQNASFWAASQKDAQGRSPLGLLERQRVKQWLRRAYEELDRLAV